MAIDPTISYGALITLATTLVSIGYGGWWFVTSMKWQLMTVTDKMTTMNVELAHIRELLQTQAVHDHRINMLERTVDDLRRGEGRILPLQPAHRHHE